MLMYYFLIGVTSFVIGVLVINILKEFSLSRNWLITKGIPLIGGIGIGLTFIIVASSGLFFYHNLSKEVVGIIISSAIMLIFGVIDDLRELSVWDKFLVQIIATGLLIFFGVKTQIIFMGNFLNIIITFIWVLGITNAFNHLDVMDGIATGIAIIVSFSFFVICFLNGSVNTAILSLTLAGVALGLFLFNFPPAKIYMGNAGSHFLGFVLAAIALAISYAHLEREVALVTPLLILGLPIFDTAFLILARIFKNNLPFKKSNDHLALRFLALGYSKRKTLFIMLVLCLFFCLSGIVVSQVSNFVGAGVVGFAFFVTLGISFKMSKVLVNG